MFSTPPPTTTCLLSTRVAQNNKHRSGKLGDIYIPRDMRTGDPRGFAFVRYHEQRDADDAIDRLDGERLNGRELRIQVIYAESVVSRLACVFSIQQKGRFRFSNTGPITPRLNPAAATTPYLFLLFVPLPRRSIAPSLHLTFMHSVWCRFSLLLDRTASSMPVNAVLTVGEKAAEEEEEGTAGGGAAAATVEAAVATAEAAAATVVVVVVGVTGVAAGATTGEAGAEAALPAVGREAGPLRAAAAAAAVPARGRALRRPTRRNGGSAVPARLAPRRHPAARRGAGAGAAAAAGGAAVATARRRGTAVTARRRGTAATVRRRGAAATVRRRGTGATVRWVLLGTSVGLS